MKKAAFMFLISVILISQMSAATDLILPEEDASGFTLINTDTDEEYTVDENTIYKNILDRTVFVNRFSTHIVLLETGNREIVVMYNASREEIDRTLFSLSFEVSSPVLILSGTAFDREIIEETNPSGIYITGALGENERAMLRRKGIAFTEIDPSSILRFHDDGSIQVINGKAHPQEGIYITCPKCGTVIYVSIPY